jgi:hypothetical protein
MVPNQYRSIPKYDPVNLVPYLPENWLRALILFLGYKWAAERKGRLWALSSEKG